MRCQMWGVIMISIGGIGVILMCVLMPWFERKAANLERDMERRRRFARLLEVARLIH